MRNFFEELFLVVQPPHSPPAHQGGGGGGSRVSKIVHYLLAALSFGFVFQDE